jgi:NADP oxidoreductase coenzyme F420-dependent
MLKDISEIRIGILGTGRLGKALAKVLGEHYKVFGWDVNIKRAKQVTKQCNVSFVPDLQQVLMSDLVLLCIPADDVIKFFKDLPADEIHRCVFLNLATDIDTRSMIEELHLHRLRVIGLKPIGQFAAMRHRVPMTFVTSHEDPEDLTLLRKVFAPIGNICLGDELHVRAINRVATKLALQFCVNFESTIQPYAEGLEWSLSALKSVAVGTMLDYPPDSDNVYTSSILKEIAENSLAAHPELSEPEHSAAVEVGR